MATTGLEVRVQHGRERAEVTRFTKTLNEIVQALREIDRVYLLRSTRATWVLADMRHQADDLVVRLEARLVPAQRAMEDLLVPVRALVEGAAELQVEATVPRLFAPATVSRLAKLATPERGLQSVTLSTYNGTVGPAVPLSDELRTNAAAAVRPFTIAYGSVTGTLSGLREVRGRTLKVTVRDTIGRQAIDGYVPDQMAEDLRQAWRHRIMLGGKVRRNARGQAIRIDVDRIERLPEGNQGRPSTDELLGAAKDWLGDLTVDQILDRVRDA